MSVVADELGTPERTVLGEAEGATLVYEPALYRGRLLRRYKRFLADVEMADGREVVAHCMNTGAMTGCAEPGSEVWLSAQNAAHRKLKWTWEIASYDGALIGINTQLPNALVALAVRQGAIEPLSGYSEVRREVKAEGKTATGRLDVWASGHPTRSEACWIEVKSVTLLDDKTSDLARFPDAKTVRGARHLEVLGDLAEAGERAVAFYLVQREATAFAPARAIDPDYTRALQRAVRRGVEAMAFGAVVTSAGVALGRQLPVLLTVADEQEWREGQS